MGSLDTTGQVLLPQQDCVTWLDALTLAPRGWRPCASLFLCSVKVGGWPEELFTARLVEAGDAVSQDDIQKAHNASLRTWQYQ